VKIPAGSSNVSETPLKNGRTRVTWIDPKGIKRTKVVPS
jgi:hypothetical protein